jgi:hypothetical protein
MALLEEGMSLYLSLAENEPTSVEVKLYQALAADPSERKSLVTRPNLVFQPAFSFSHLHPDEGCSTAVGDMASQRCKTRFPTFEAQLYPFAQQTRLEQELDVFCQASEGMFTRSAEA